MKRRGKSAAASTYRALICLRENKLGLLRQIHIHNMHVLYVHTRKYPLLGYILGVLTQTTALDGLWVGMNTKLSFNIPSLASLGPKL